MMRRLFRLRLWYLDLTVELLEDQKGRVFRDLQAARRERADLIRNAIEKGLMP